MCESAKQKAQKTQKETEERKMKKTMKAGAFALTLALAASTIGGVIPARSVATAREIAVADDKDTKDTLPGWMIDGEWIPAEDTTVSEEIQKMIIEPLLHAVGVGRNAIMYLGSRITEKGTDHCVLVRSFPVVPNPIYSYALYYIHENQPGKYEIFNTRVLKEAEYSEYSVIRYVKLNKTSIKIKKGKKVTLKAEYLPKNDEQVTYEWISTNKKVATVKNGVIKAKKKGTCAIYCKVKGDYEVNAMCLVKVK